MKFAEHLSAHITPEWRKQYIQYEVMKEMIYSAVEQAPSAEVTDQEMISRYFAKIEENFLQFSDKELLKINTFFSEKLAEASRKFATLKSELILQDIPTKSEKRGSILLKKPTPNSRKMHDLKLAFSEFYLSLILLQNYQTLNFTGFRKILKKFDKELNTSTGAKWRVSNVESAPFYTTKQVDQIIKETESVFTSQLESGNRQRAMKRLRVPPLGQEQNPWTTFRLGLFVGCFVIMVITIVIVATVQYINKDTNYLKDFPNCQIVNETLCHHFNFKERCYITFLPINFTNINSTYFICESSFIKNTDLKTAWIPAIHLYRGMFLTFLCCFLLGLNTYGWRSSGVNHILIFELDPRYHLNHQQLLEVSCFFAVIWCVSVLCFLFSLQMNLPIYSSPLVLVLLCILMFFNPLPVFYHKARFWLLKILFRIVTAPFHYVGFADFWLADQLNSLTEVLLDFEFMVCFYTYEIDWKVAKLPTVCGSDSYGIRPLVKCLPAWFRFAQCLRRYRDTRLIFPHIVNAGKYSTTFFVVLFQTLHNQFESKSQLSTFFYLYIFAKVISTIYTLTWDIKMDWGLLDKNAGENKFLREEVVYASKYYYYFAIIEDFVLRFKWIISIILIKNGYVTNEIVVTVMASLEVFRRFIWNFFRLENEHLNNCGQFRAVRDISIAPIDADDQAQLENMMDEEDGVSNRHRNEKQKLINNSIGIRTLQLKLRDYKRSAKMETKVLIGNVDDEDEDDDD